MALGKPEGPGKHWEDLADPFMHFCVLFESLWLLGGSPGTAHQLELRQSAASERGVSPKGHSTHMAGEGRRAGLAGCSQDTLIPAGREPLADLSALTPTPSPQVVRSHAATPVGGDGR